MLEQDAFFDGSTVPLPGRLSDRPVGHLTGWWAV